jgi:Cu/Ag efflux pump CusA
VTIGQSGVGTQLTDGFVNMAYAVQVAIGLVYLPMVIVFRWLLVPFVILCALPLAVIGAFVALAAIGYATNIITSLAVSLQATVLPVTGITAGMWIAYSVAGGLYGVALAAAVMLSMAGIAVAVDPMAPSPTTREGSPRWPSCRTRCAPSPMRSTP